MAADREQQEREQNRLLGLAARPDLESELAQRRAVNDREVELADQGVLRVRQQHMMSPRQPILQPAAFPLFPNLQ